ncbi:sigma-70 family RNA polymerase sigma factor [Bradyrhizobium tunisiense]|uniref:sigma-70 family RNA polymerase sigma factor n=1 Tax=Bradyrhizobium tunisiense TaxID=3278709 RepID=UPI0035E38AC7
MTDTTQEAPIEDPRENGLGAADQFERYRRYLTGLAYRMLGSMVEAEDAVQEAYIRWHGTEKESIESVRAFLAKVVVRICLDQMKSARATRETYVGSWLPEPVLNAETFGAETASEYATDLSVGLMLALERLSPLERAAFLLHDVFDVGFDQVAQLIERNEAACRQLAARGRVHVRRSRPRFQVQPDKGDEILQAFMNAYQTGNIDALANILAEDAVLHTDGGGKRKAALNPIVGRAKILALLAGVARKRRDPLGNLRPATINGLPGCLAALASGDILSIALEIVSDRIKAVYVVRNPDKLKHVSEEVEHESS